jgi:hypothetical protein
MAVSLFWFDSGHNFFSLLVYLDSNGGKTRAIASESLSIAMTFALNQQWLMS